ncbi:MAG TPA: PAS domain-containing protein [Spirosoma sp.]|jgi:PAS domain S-box-containing protein|nr:PAS domain-containing protein [Spirosoma sp.]
MNTSKFSLEPSDQQNPQLPHEGNPSYPVAAYEITLLTQAQWKTKSREMTFFEQLTDQHQWVISLKQRQQYLNCVKQGFTLILTNQAKIIQWTTANFFSMTGYSSGEAVGQTPRMLQGSLTDPVTTRQVSDSLRASESVRADLLNYRKSGKPYMCRLQIDPLRNRQGGLTHFLGLAIEAKTTEGFRLTRRMEM